MSAVDLQLGATASLLLGQDGSVKTHACLPSGRSPRLLVPLQPTRAASASVRRYTVAGGRMSRALHRGAAGLARLGALRGMPHRVSLGGAGTFVEHLEQVLSIRPLIFAVHLGPPRANRKPVFHVLDARGASVAYVKLGVDALTCRRVRHEIDALEQLDRVHTPGLVIPQLISAGVWNGHDYLIMRPLRTDHSHTPGRALRQRATASLVGAFTKKNESLREADWLARALEELQASGESEDARRLGALIEQLVRTHGDEVLVTGAGHGDWSRWNMSAADGELVVWDWERFRTDVPLGWDELHYSIGSFAGGVAAALADPRRLLRETGVDGASRKAELVLACYLVSRGASYLADKQHEAGAATGSLGDWLLPALEQLVRPTWQK